MNFEKVAYIYDQVIGAMDYEAWSEDIKFLIEKYSSKKNLKCLMHHVVLAVI